MSDMSIKIDNPTQLNFTHTSLRADSVVFIPTPNNNSDLATMITDTFYYTIENDTGCRYKKVITPKVSVTNVKTNCRKVDNSPVPAKVCQYGINGGELHYEVDNEVRTVSFDSDHVAAFTNSTIPDSEIFFKDSNGAPIDLTVFNTNNSVELTDITTKTSFSFKVPSCVHKVEIQHNMDATASAESKKTKIHIDLDNSNNTYYINEKHNNDGSISIATNKSGVSLKSVLSKDNTEINGLKSSIFKIELGENNWYYIEDVPAAMGVKDNIDYNVYRFYQNSTVNGKKHAYSFMEDDKYTVKYFTDKLANYEVLMKFSKLSEEDQANATPLDGIEGRPATGVRLVVNPEDMSISFEYSQDTYYTSGVSNFPGLYTFCKDIVKDIVTATGECTGCFFLEGTNHIFKIDVENSNKAWQSYKLTADDVESDLPVFTGVATTDKYDVTWDDTCTSLLNFGALCDAFENVKSNG